MTSAVGSQTFLNGRVVLHAGDMLEVLRTLPDNSVDAVVTDPPYGLSFMGKAWDHGVPSAVMWREVLRVVKPGGHLVAFAGTRTQHRMASAIEDAGFEVRDMLAWLYGSGFPKSYDVAKGIDKLDVVGPLRERALRFTAWMRSTGITGKQINDATATSMASHYLTDKAQPAVATREHFEKLRPLLGEVPAWVEDLVDSREVESENLKRREVIGQHDKEAQAARWRGDYTGSDVAEAGNITVAFTPEAQAWQGWGTALKPALEPITFARKPLIGTVAANVMAHGTGALNIDACRVGVRERPKVTDPKHSGHAHSSYGAPSGGGKLLPDARWPANVLHDGSDEVVESFPETTSGVLKAGTIRNAENRVYGKGMAAAGVAATLYDTGGDNGSAARFFYSAKADADDRIGSKHPTVKPVDLMRWLVRLVTPSGGTVLDPFAGTGTTGEAAFREGFSAVLIEREAEYRADIARRMALCLAGSTTRAAAIAREKNKGKPVDHGPLFELDGAL